MYITYNDNTYTYYSESNDMILCVCINSTLVGGTNLKTKNKFSISIKPLQKEKGLRIT